MKKQLTLSSVLLLLTALCVAQAGTLMTSPIIFVQPASLDFGTVDKKHFVTNSFVVENVGGGTLVGRAEVAPPFKIIAGETYRLKHADLQVVTIVYTPDNAGTNVESVKFTGAVADASAPVTGKLCTVPPWYHRKHK